MVSILLVEYHNLPLFSLPIMHILNHLWQLLEFSVHDFWLNSKCLLMDGSANDSVQTYLCSPVKSTAFFIR